jgi:hypothetical protein
MAGAFRQGWCDGLRCLPMAVRPLACALRSARSSGLLGAYRACAEEFVRCWPASAWSIALACNVVALTAAALISLVYLMGGPSV